MSKSKPVKPHPGPLRECDSTLNLLEDLQDVDGVGDDSDMDAILRRAMLESGARTFDPSDVNPLCVVSV